MTTYKEFVVREKAAQVGVDQWYASRGWTSARDKACKLFDCVLSRGVNQHTVEEKFRSRIRDDILIELIQDANTGELGWFFTTGCDYLHYIMAGEGGRTILYRIEWPGFKAWLLQDPKRFEYGTKVSADGYGMTINIVVPIKVIPETIIQWFDYANGID